MNDLDDKRQEKGIVERARLVFFSKKQKEREVRFNQMESTERILDFQYQTDSDMIFNLFLKWFSKSKNESQKNVLQESISALMRMKSYCDTLQTVSKNSVIQLNEERLINSKLGSEILELKKQIESQRKEIEYYDQD